MAPEQLNEVFQIRISTVEKRMLSELADRHGFKLAQCVRHLIRTSHEAEFGKLATKPKKKTK